jgi:heat shock protein HslJ
MKLALLALPALLAAEPAAARVAIYHAVGTEPGWTLDIGGGSIVYVGDYGKTRITTRTPAPRVTFNGRRYVTRRITIDITRATCSDGMSDREYPERVTVTIGRRTVRGCGGVPVATAAQLDGSRWTIIRVDGRPIRTARPTDIRFSGDRVSGNAGCNGFSGIYRVVGGKLEAARIISTKMACVGVNGSPVTPETKVFAVLAGPAHVRMDGDTMTLTAASGSVELRRTPD